MWVKLKYDPLWTVFGAALQVVPPIYRDIVKYNLVPIKINRDDDSNENVIHLLLALSPLSHLIGFLYFSQVLLDLRMKRKITLHT